MRRKQTGKITFNLHDKLLAYCALNRTGLLPFFPEVLDILNSFADHVMLFISIFSVSSFGEISARS